MSTTYNTSNIEYEKAYNAAFDIFFKQCCDDEMNAPRQVRAKITNNNGKKYDGEKTIVTKDWILDKISTSRRMVQSQRFNKFMIRIDMTQDIIHLDFESKYQDYFKRSQFLYNKQFKDRVIQYYNSIGSFYVKFGNIGTDIKTIILYPNY